MYIPGKKVHMYTFMYLVREIITCTYIHVETNILVVLVLAFYMYVCVRLTVHVVHVCSCVHILHTYIHDMYIHTYMYDIMRRHK